MENDTQINYQAFLILGTIGMLLLAFGVTFFIYFYQRKLLKKKIAFQEIEDLLKQQELHSAYTLLKGQDMERKRISQELHDNLGSQLVTLKMYADSAVSAPSTNQKNEFLSKISKLVEQASNETRKLSHELDSVALKHFGLETAIADLKSTIESLKKTKITTSVILEDNLSSNMAYQLYRVIQELVNNTLKHAYAGQISIDIHQDERQHLHLIYKDNGVGFDIGKAKKGMGLLNIRSRINELSGELYILSNSGGTSITIEIPLYEN